METRPHGSVLLLICLTIGGPFTRAGQVIQVKEGQDLQFNCYFQEDSFLRIFCKNHCEASGEYLIGTFSSDWASEGRYRLEWEERASSHYVLRVFIQNMQKSDTGSYSCILYDWEKHTTQPAYIIKDVEIYVISADSGGSDAVISKPSSESKQDITDSKDVWLYVGLALSFLVLLSLILTALHQRRGATDTVPLQRLQ
ncbi:unnamed protein product [Knipowitschia caucasica]|uniref:Ig-like domain-containing protein n=1 Tax=Knipowitschia caucasica TaxID=637954 RepID=A0AAV2KNH5_KNICA